MKQLLLHLGVSWDSACGRGEPHVLSWHSDLKGGENIYSQCIEMKLHPAKWPKQSVSDGVSAKKKPGI